jgi:hypothetical protein
MSLASLSDRRNIRLQIYILGSAHAAALFGKDNSSCGCIYNALLPFPENIKSSSFPLKMKLSALLAIAVISIATTFAREELPVPDKCGAFTLKSCGPNLYCERGVRS